MDLEAKARDHQKVIDLQENDIAKVRDEVTTYQQLLEVNIEFSNVNGGLFGSPIFIGQDEKSRG